MHARLMACEEIADAGKLSCPAATHCQRMRERASVLLALLLFSLALPANAFGPWRASEANTRGWQLMTPEERIEHQSTIRGFVTLEECRAYQVKHHQSMEERARQRNRVLPSGGKDICAHLKPGPARP